MPIRRKTTLFLTGVLTAFCCTLQQQARAQMNLANLTTVMVDQKPLFQIVTGSGGRSAAERTSLIEQRIKEAVQAANPGMPEIVAIRNFKGERQLFIGKTYIGTADAGTAASQGLSSAQLAAEWAGALKKALADHTSLAAATVATVSQDDEGTAAESYVPKAGIGQIASVPASVQTPAQTTVVQIPAVPSLDFPVGEQQTIAINDSTGAMRFTSLPQGLVMSIAVANPTKPARVGDAIEARTTEPVVLPSGETVRAGTLIRGEIEGISSESGLRHQRTFVQLHFDTMTLSDGTHFPISARVAPITAEQLQSGKPIKLRLQSRAQVAVTGTVL